MMESNKQRQDGDQTRLHRARAYRVLLRVSKILRTAALELQNSLCKVYKYPIYSAASELHRSGYGHALTMPPEPGAVTRPLTQPRCLDVVDSHLLIGVKVTRR